MKYLTRMLALVVLACALSASAFAGEIDCGKTGELAANTDKVSASASDFCGDISCGVTQAAMNLVLSLL